MRARKGDKRHDLAAGEVVQRRKLCRDEAPRGLFSPPSRQTTLLHTNFGEFLLVSVAASLEDDRPARCGRLPRGHLGLHRATCQACCAIGMEFVIVRICEPSLTVQSYPYIERATFTRTWLQWPHWDVVLLTMPPTRKARGPDAAAGRSQQATHRRAGAVETSQRLTGSACYPAISWCIRCSLVGLVLRTHTMLPPSTQCKWTRTACQS